MNLGDMRNRAKQLADMENSSFIVDTEWNDMLNEAARKLYMRLVDVRGNEYYAEEETISVVDGTSVYSLPDDFMFLLIAILDDGSRFSNMKTWENNELPYIMQIESSGTPNLHDIRYRLRPKKIELRPTPKSDDYTLTMRYIPKMPKLVGDLAEFDGVNGWEHWIYYSAAIEALLKEESHEAANNLRMERAKLEEEIEGLKGRRDIGKPSRIVDTRRDWVGDYLYEDDWNL